MKMKWFALLGLVLFFGVATAPRITAEMYDNESIEITTEFCGLEKKRLVKLTHQEVYEIHILLESLRVQTNQTTSQEQFIEIINNAIDELEKYGLFGDLNSNQIKQLIYRNQVKQENKICLLIGRTSETTFYGPGITLLNILISKLPIPYSQEYINMILYWYQIINICRPLNNGGLGHTICIGKYHIDDVSGGSGFRPANGWIASFGINGLQTSEGPIKGNISLTNFKQYYALAGAIDYPGITGFIGLKINLNWRETSWFYLGSAANIIIEKH